MSNFKDWIIDETDGSNFLKNHTKIFMNYWGYDVPEDVSCMACHSPAVDIHHIKGRGMGSSDKKDHPTNLASLCRACHEKTESKKFNAFVYTKLLERIIDKVESDGRI